MNRYFIGLSLLLNALLLIFLFGLLPFLLYISVLTNFFFVWYVLRLINNMNSVEEDFVNILNTLESFTDHLEGIHALEMFYGDETLKELIDHSREVINDVIDIQEKHFNVEVLEEQDDREDETPPPE
tara:strand:+ start:408 stop:788 length:381 start_codon:yes stop_codon:yes gene_type:complete